MTLLVGQREEYLACKTDCWYFGDGDLTGVCTSYSSGLHHCHRLLLHHVWITLHWGKSRFMITVRWGRMIAHDAGFVGGAELCL